MDSNDIQHYLQLVGEELEAMGTHGKILLLGGAVMMLQVGNRNQTKDVDAAFEENAQAIREAVSAVAEKEDLDETWLNDGAKGFLYSEPDTVLLGNFAGLEVYIPTLDYLLAMKVIAGRDRDIRDADALVVHLGLQAPQEVLDILIKYIPRQYLTAQVQYTVESLFSEE